MISLAMRERARAETQRKKGRKKGGEGIWLTLAVPLTMRRTSWCSDVMRNILHSVITFLALPPLRRGAPESSSFRVRKHLQDVSKNGDENCSGWNIG